MSHLARTKGYTDEATTLHLVAETKAKRPGIPAGPRAAALRRKCDRRALGNPLAFSLTGGDAHDITQAPPLATSRARSPSRRFITSLEVRAIKAVIPPRSNRKVKRACDFALYAERNIVKRFSNSMKQYRGIATLY